MEQINVLFLLLGPGLKFWQNCIDRKSKAIQQSLPTVPLLNHEEGQPKPARHFLFPGIHDKSSKALAHNVHCLFKPGWGSKEPTPCCKPKEKSDPRNKSWNSHKIRIYLFEGNCSSASPTLFTSPDENSRIFTEHSWLGKDPQGSLNKISCTSFLAGLNLISFLYCGILKEDGVGRSLPCFSAALPLGFLEGSRCGIAATLTGAPSLPEAC